MLAQLSTLFTEVLGWIGEFVTSLTTEGGDLYGLLPLFILGIGISLSMVIMKLVRKVTWGS